MPEPAVQRVTLADTTCELNSPIGHSESLPGVAQLSVGGGVAVAVGVVPGVGVGVGVVPGVGVEAGSVVVGVAVAPIGREIVKGREALRWLNASLAWIVWCPVAQVKLTRIVALKVPSPRVETTVFVAGSRVVSSANLA